MIAFVLTALAMATLTWLLGWWGVVVAAFVAGGLLHRRGAGAWVVAAAAVIGWCALFLVDSIGGRFAALATSVAGVMRLPVPALLIVALLFAALLAWSAAVVGGEIERMVRATRPPG
jgi:hypothetical protein